MDVRENTWIWPGPEPAGWCVFMLNQVECVVYSYMSVLTTRWVPQVIKTCYCHERYIHKYSYALPTPIRAPIAFIYTHTHIHVSIYTYIYTHIPTHKRRHVNIYTQLHAYIPTYIYIHRWVWILHGMVTLVIRLNLSPRLTNSYTKRYIHALWRGSFPGSFMHS